MVYFDTSFLAPLFLEEATSAAVERFIASLPPGELAVSLWTGVEFSSLLAREVRMGALPPHAARAADAQFEAVIAESFILLAARSDDFDRARRYLRAYETGLRAGDALHLAIASGHGAEAIYTFDRSLLKAGALLGLPVAAGI